MKITANRRIETVKSGNGWAILQTKPSIRTLKFVDRYAYCHKLQLALPYVVFGCTRKFIGEYRLPFLGFSNKPIEKDNDLIYFPLLPSVQRHWSVCLDPFYHPTKANSFEELCGLFWMMEFKMYGNLRSSKWISNTLLADTFLKSYQNWEKITLQMGSPDFMLDFDKLYQHIVGGKNGRDFLPVQFGEVVDKLKARKTCEEITADRVQDEPWYSDYQ
jgi:hypothetical protein